MTWNSPLLLVIDDPSIMVNDRIPVKFVPSRAL